jgi:MFS family permease
MSQGPSSYRWVVLAIYAWIAGLSQLLWLNFAPILSFVEKHYAIGESTASLLLMIFPLTYVLLSVHAGALIDAKGYRFAIGLGAILMAAFSCLRIYTGNFWVLLVAQTGISLGQPYIVNAVTKLVLDWFPKEQAVLATGLGTVGLFAGMAIGLAATPPSLEALGYTGSMVAFAAITCVSCVAFFILCKPKGTLEAAEASAGISLGFLSKLTDRNLLPLFIISFLGLGFFNGLTSWIEAILATNGIDSARAGIVGAALIIGGIAGSIAIPALSDQLKRRKPFLLLSIVAAAATLVPLCRSGSYSTLLLFGFLQGFFFLPAYALLLDMTSLEAGERWAGSATGVLMMIGNGGGVLVIMLMGWIKGEQTGFPSAMPFLLVLLVLSAVAASLTREPPAPVRATSLNN